MIRAGTRIRFEVAGTAASSSLIPFGAFSRPTGEQIRAAVAEWLLTYFEVQSLTVTDVATLSDAYTAVAVLEPKSDYADIDDVKSIVAAGFWEAAHAAPTVTAPGYGDESQPAPEKPPNIFESFAETLGDVLKWAGVAIAALVVLQLVSTKR